MWSALLTLVLPLVLGALAARARLLEGERLDGSQLIAALNRFALTIAFPALIVAAWLDPERRMQLDPGLAAATVAGLGAGVAFAWLVGGRVVGGAALPARGALALVALFGNSAYLGLPLVAAVLGPDALGGASFVVALHVTVSVTLGSYLLARWSGRPTSGSKLLRSLLSSPLAWAPVLGALLSYVLRGADLSEHEVTVAVFRALDTLGKTASPLGLCVLGLFLAQPRAQVGTASAELRGETPSSDLAFAVVRLVIVPLATLGAGVALRAQGWLSADALRLAVLLAAVPAAISTFAMAHDAGVEPQRVARAIVTTTLLSIATIPAFLWLTERVL